MRGVDRTVLGFVAAALVIIAIPGSSVTFIVIVVFAVLTLAGGIYRCSWGDGLLGTVDRWRGWRGWRAAV